MNSSLGGGCPKAVEDGFESLAGPNTSHVRCHRTALQSARAGEYPPKALHARLEHFRQAL